MLISNRGKHLHIRQALPEDAEIFHQAYASDEFSRLFRANGERQTVEELRLSLTERAAISPETLGYVEFAILLDGQPIGVAVLSDYAPLHRRAEFLVGIFSPSKRHSSHSVEASLLMLDLVFNHYGLNKLYTYVYEYNQYSQKATEKLGFIREGLLRDHHFSVPEQHFIGLYQNGLTERDFRYSTKLSILSRRLLGRDITQMVKTIPVTALMEITYPIGLDGLVGQNSSCSATGS
jgi:RimJ/RimL family protein N-acetyltransferase